MFGVMEQVYLFSPSLPSSEGSRREIVAGSNGSGMRKENGFLKSFETI
jgi:hypothetical protein